MDSKQLLKVCLENGLLVDKDVLNLFNGAKDINSVKLIIDKLKNYTRQNIITKNIFYEHKEKVNEFFYELPQKSQKELENFKIKLGLSIEISREKESIVDEKNSLSINSVKSNSSSSSLVYSDSSESSDSSGEVLILSSFHWEKINKKIARIKAYIHHTAIIIITTAKMINIKSWTEFELAPTFIKTKIKN